MKTNKEDVIKFRDRVAKWIDEYEPKTKWEAANHRQFIYWKRKLKKLDYAIERWEEREKGVHKDK